MRIVRRSIVGMSVFSSLVLRYEMMVSGILYELNDKALPARFCFTGQDFDERYREVLATPRIARSE